MMMLKKVEGPRHDQFGRALPSEALARPGVELPGDGIELFLAEPGQIGARGHVLGEQSIGVLVDTALPRAMRIGEVNFDAGDCGQPLMLSEPCIERGTNRGYLDFARLYVLHQAQASS
jgi:hypothetical protein